VVVTGHLIRSIAARSDLKLLVAGSVKDYTLTYSSTKQWEDGVVHWTGTLNKGTHRFALQSTTPNAWGCGGSWGDMDILVLPKAALGVDAYQVVDKRSGCPPAAKANTDLVKQDFNVLQTSIVDVTGHMIRRQSGRADLHLYVDGKIKDWSLSYTSSTQWEDVQLHWIGQLSKGKHTVSLRSNKANVFGCGTAWGDIDVLVVPRALKPYVCTLKAKTGEYVSKTCTIGKCTNAKPGQVYSGAAPAGKTACPVKACSNKLQSGQYYTSGCNVATREAAMYQTGDSRGGCPGSWAANKD